MLAGCKFVVIKFRLMNEEKALRSVLAITHVLSSLQCYSVLSTIAQVLRKMSLKILASRFLMPYLSQTFESYQRVKIYTYSVNDSGLKKF